VLLLFDSHKLDISDELKGTIEVLKGHEDKIRCILNKADQIDRQQLMRVYGALLWSLGKTMASPEVARVYVGSFWQEPLKNLDNAALFEMEEKELMRDLAILPRQSAVRKINELVKRIRKVKTLAYIIGHLKAEMPTVMGKEKKQKKLINDLPNVFRQILKKFNLAAGDFPEITSFSSKLAECPYRGHPQAHGDAPQREGLAGNAAREDGRVVQRNFQGADPHQRQQVREEGRRRREQPVRVLAGRF
jgi:Domain of unknown function (DUF5600)